MNPKKGRFFSKRKKSIKPGPNNRYHNHEVVTIKDATVLEPSQMGNHTNRLRDDAFKTPMMNRSFEVEFDSAEFDDIFI